jgi:enoyl-CoA hydratase
MSEVILDIDGGVATLLLNAPSRRNALTPLMAMEMVQAVNRVDQDTTIGALVVKGAAETFCAGADLGSLQSISSSPAHPENYDALDKIYDAFRHVGASAALTIAVVQGYAVGAGMNLALACDLILADSNAVFRSGFRNLGLHPGGGHQWLLARHCGPQAAIFHGILGEPMSGLDAVDCGLALECLEGDALDDRAFDLANRAADDVLLTRQMIKSHRLTLSNCTTWDQAIGNERGPQMWSFARNFSLE